MEQRLKQDITRLAGTIGERNDRKYGALKEAAAYITAVFSENDREPERLEFQSKGKQVANIELEIRGARRPADIFVVGAHYDTVAGSPGANDNASGVAVLLALARHFSRKPGARTLRLLAFANGERPFARTPEMGSALYAARCGQRGENILGMLSLDTLGFSSEEPGSQWLSFGGLLLPKKANFLALIGNKPSRPLLERVSGLWQSRSAIALKPLTLSTNFPGARDSGQWPFWKEGFPALLLTDTARLRYRHYHKATDTPDQLNYEWLEGVSEGVIATVEGLIGDSGAPTTKFVP
ncbi:MAG: M28 family peptidase [Chthoniobacteraceae bacterium]